MTDTALQAPPIEPARPSSRPDLDVGFDPRSAPSCSSAPSRPACSSSPTASIGTSRPAARRPPAACPSSSCSDRAADRARLRVRQRLPRHRQRGRHRDLHPLAAGRTSRWSGRASSTSSGVLASSGAVAFGIISLLPVELILQVGPSAGFAMVFALLIAAIIWNLGTWYLGLPASSLAHADRLDHRRRHRQRADARPRRHLRRRLGARRPRSATRCCSRR